MRNVTNRILQVILLLFLMSSCEISNFGDKDDDNGNISIEGAGELVEKKISLSDFSSINNIGVMDINVTIGDEASVTLRAQENLMDYITCETKGDVLKLGVEDNVSINSSKGLFADVVMQSSINKINIIGTGNITLAGERQEKLDINITGTGNVNAFELEVDDCSIRSTGTGNCKVYVHKNLSVYITGLGRVYFKGEPRIQQTIIGLGGVVDSN